MKKATGVADATGRVSVDGAHVIGPNGKVLPSTGAPRLGSNWSGEDSLVHLAQGHAPQADDQIVVNGYTAQQGELKVGDQVGVITLGIKHTYSWWVSPSTAATAAPSPASRTSCSPPPKRSA